MQTRNEVSPISLAALAVIAASALLCRPAAAEPGAQPRLSRAIDPARTLILRGSVPPQARPDSDIGRLPGATEIQGASLYFKPSEAQSAVLDELLREQQDPASENYQRWLTTAEYASRFGMAEADLAKVQQWLIGQGFKIDSIAPSKTRISFSGSAAQIEAAFATEMHRYSVAGETHFANALELSIPAALSEVVLGVGNLADFRPHARVKPLPASAPAAHFTSDMSGNHYVVPNDFATIYNLKPLYAATPAITGAGEKIAVVGQTAINSSDLAAFRTASGLSAAKFVPMLVPGTGSSANLGGGDEMESNLDVEWAGAVATDATIVFVYTGNAPNKSVFDALNYAIENNLAPIISVSYGECEPQAGSSSQAGSDIALLEPNLKLANTLGQTVVLASGDAGAADCDSSTDPTMPITTASMGLAVDYPSSSIYVTSVGGTEFSDKTGSFWSAGNDSGNGSALSYIPEIVWNDTSSGGGLAASGGGASIRFTKPSWQTGAGVPADGHRDVPDIALAASNAHDPYLYCSAGSCVNRFRNTDQTLSAAGGTSFGAPTFAGVLALINQQTGSKGLGNVNPRLYALAGTAGVFHDITSGSNSVPCKAGTPNCGSSGTLGYAATAGYDRATGLGSFDGDKLVTAWTLPASGGSSGGGGAISLLTLLLLGGGAGARRLLGVKA